MAGSVESIAEITAETLYHCHEAFYTPSNMVLCVAGNVDPEEVCALAREILPGENKPAIPRDRGADEPREAGAPYSERTMAVATPLFQMGVKVRPGEDGPAQLRQRLHADGMADRIQRGLVQAVPVLGQAGRIGHRFTGDEHIGIVGQVGAHKAVAVFKLELHVIPPYFAQCCI